MTDLKEDGEHHMSVTTSASTLASGLITKVAGPVVDVEFPPDSLPEINYAIEVDLEVEGKATTLICEVAQQLGDDRIRAVAFAPTDGLVRGAVVRNTGAPISVPVGDQTLGHIFNRWGVLWLPVMRKLLCLGKRIRG